MQLDPLRLEFESLTGAGIRVAVIDTGIDANHPAVGAVSGGTRFIAEVGGAISQNSDWADDFGHGTACAAIIRKLAPECELLAVKISSGTDPIASKLLVAGIGWAVGNGADVINVSSGTTAKTNVKAMADSCLQAANAGVVIVAAESNTEEKTYPAALDTVIAVGGGGSDRKQFSYFSDPDRHNRFITYSGHQKVAWLGGRYILINGASFGAARMSAIVALILSQSGGLVRERLLEMLHYNSRNPRRIKVQSSAPAHDDALSSPLAWIRRGAIYPFSKEMHSVVRFRHLLQFELAAVADPAGKGCVGKDAGAVIGIPPINMIVNASLPKALEGADTLILGFTNTLSRLLRRDIKRELIQRAIDLGKNVYCFEPLDGETHGPLLAEAERRGLRIAWPAVDRSDLEELRSEATVPASYDRTPILGVVGTSPSQGKFTLQLILRERLQALGLQVGQIGTEHQSALFGMDDCFPVGHVQSVFIEGPSWPEYFDLRYQQIVRSRKVDIIVVGSQGGILPHKLDIRGRTGIIHNILFPAATQCDSFILVVNHLDSHERIQDTIDVLRIVGGGRVILLALSTLRGRIVESFGRRLIVHESIDAVEQEEHLRRLEDHFQLPAVSILGKDGSQRLIDTVLKRYAAKDE